MPRPPAHPPAPSSAPPRHTLAESPKSGLFNTGPFIKHLAGLSKVAPIEKRTTGQAKG
ncbi:hypothetical protein GCM10022420_058050 [Streptomyces iranensis]